MNLKEVMQYNTFVVVGNTTNPSRYACKIKESLIEKGYVTYGVWKELESIDEVTEDIDIINLCINAKYGLQYIKETTKSYKGIVIQPGAEGKELIEYLREKKIPYIESCLLVGLNLYTKEM